MNARGFVDALLDGAPLDDVLTERFLDRGPSAGDVAGGSGGAAGGSPMSNASDRVQGPGNAPACPSCANALQTGPDGASNCPVCGFTRAFNVDSQQQGSNGVSNGSKRGYLRVPGGSFDTNEGAAGIVRLKFNGNMMFEMDLQGTRIEHALGNANEVMTHRLHALGYNKDRVMCSLIEWLFKEAGPGEELIWNLVDGSRMVLDRNGYQRHVESYYDQ